MHPAVAGPLIDGKRHVAHSQPWMAALFDIAWRSAKAADQEVAQPNLRACEIVGRIHGTEHLVVGNLCIKRAHETGEALFANACVDLLFRERHNSSMSDEAPKSAYELAMERLRRADADAGVAERSLTEEQKAQIAEVKRVYSAKTAEAEILYNAKLMSTFEPEERAKLEQGHRRDLERIKADQERKLVKIRG